MLFFVCSVAAKFKLVKLETSHSVFSDLILYDNKLGLLHHTVGKFLNIMNRNDKVYKTDVI